MYESIENGVMTTERGYEDSTGSQIEWNPSPSRVADNSRTYNPEIITDSDLLSANL